MAVVWIDRNGWKTVEEIKLDNVVVKGDVEITGCLRRRMQVEIWKQEVFTGGRMCKYDSP